MQARKSKGARHGRKTTIVTQSVSSDVADSQESSMKSCMKSSTEPKDGESPKDKAVLDSHPIQWTQDMDLDAIATGVDDLDDETSDSNSDMYDSDSDEIEDDEDVLKMLMSGIDGKDQKSTIRGEQRVLKKESKRPTKAKGKTIRWQANRIKRSHKKEGNIG